jgi:hypothetical protein
MLQACAEENRDQINPAPSVEAYRRFTRNALGCPGEHRLRRPGTGGPARHPGCEFTFVPGMDHLPPLREPALVLDVITRTLARAGW